MAFCPIGVEPPGVIIGVMLGVAPPGVMLGVAAPLAPLGVMLGVAEGVSSHLDLRLLALPAGVSDTILSPGWTDLGVSAHPSLVPVSLSVLGVSSHLFLLVLAPGVAEACPGVSPPIIFSRPGVVWAGVGSHILAPAPAGVSEPGSFRPGVSAQAAPCEGVADSAVKNEEAGFLAVLEGVSSDVWSQRPRLFGAAFAAPLVSTGFKVPSLAFSAICFLYSASVPFNSCSLMISA